MSSIVIAGDNSGTIRLQAPSTITAGAVVLTLPVVTGSIVGTDASGNISVYGDIISYASSDNTLKENIQDITGALSIVEAIGGKTFDWTDEYIDKRGGVDKYFVNKSDFGVIAQDVQSVFPVAVRTRDDGTLAVDYVKLCALAFAAIKELKNEVDNLRKSL